jgi:hypothetical protein
LITSRLYNNNQKEITTRKKCFRFLNKIIPIPHNAIAGIVNALRSNHPSLIPINQIRESVKVVPIFAPSITQIACCNHNTPDHTRARVINDVTEELCKRAVDADHVSIADQLYLVKRLSRVDIDLE